MYKVGGHGGDLGGYDAGGMANQNAFQNAMKGGAPHGMMSTTAMQSGSVSITVTISITIGRQAHQAGQQAQGVAQHLGGATHTNAAPFQAAHQALGNAMHALGHMLQQLFATLNGGQQQGGYTGGSMMGQLQGLLDVIKLLGNMMQGLQQNAYQGGGQQQAKPDAGGIQGALAQMQQLMVMLGQVEQGMGQIQGGQTQDQGKGQAQNQGQTQGQDGGAHVGHAGGMGGYGFTPNYDALPEMAEGQWAADHGGYEKKDDGTVEITKGKLAGHTLQWNAEIKAHLVIDANGCVCGKWTPKKPDQDQKVASPIAFDMNGDGQIGTTGETTAKDGARSELGNTVQFDIDGDGTKDSIEWMSGDGDALLVDNRDGNAANDMDGARLFGDQGGQFANGYDKLAQLDANGDGQLTGAELNGLELWADDGDAVVEAGEMVSAAAAGVTRISTQMGLEQNAKGEDLMRSAATVAGEEMMTEDVWFGQET